MYFEELKPKVKDLAERVISTGAETALGLMLSYNALHEVNFKLLISTVSYAMVITLLKWAVKECGRGKADE